MRVQAYDLVQILGRHYSCAYGGATLGSRPLSLLHQLKPTYHQQNTQHGILFSIGGAIPLSKYEQVSESLLQLMSIPFPTAEEESKVHRCSLSTICFDSTNLILYSLNPNLLLPKVEAMVDYWSTFVMEITLCNL